MDFFAFASQNARAEFRTEQPKAEPKPEFCRYCLFMRDLSVRVRDDGSCPTCEAMGRE